MLVFAFLSLFIWHARAESSELTTVAPTFSSTIATVSTLAASNETNSTLPSASACLTSEDCILASVCVNGACVACSTDAQCIEHGDLQICSNSTTPASCLHKALVPYSALYDTLGFLVMFVSGSTAASGGIGGGELHVPVLILLLEFSLRDTVPLSTMLCLGVGVGNLLQMTFKRHPYADRPLIDLWTAGVISPMMLIGTVLGVLLNQMVPNWFVLVLLVVTMAGTVYRTGKRGVKMWREENERTETVASDMELANYQGEVITGGVGDAKPVTLERATSSKRQQRVEKVQRRRQEQLEKEKTKMSKYDRIALDYVQGSEKNAPWRVLGAMVVCLVVVGAASFLKGSGLAASAVGVQPCSVAFWILLLLPVAVLPPVWAVIAYRLRTKYRERLEVPGYQRQPGDVEWSVRNLLLVGLASVVIGLVTSLLGVGGGVLTVPMLLELKMLPEVAVAVSSVMVFFNSASSVTQFAILGRIELGYGLVCFFIGLAGSIFGVRVIGYLVDKYDKSSVIVIMLVVALFASLVLVVVVGVLEFTQDARIDDTAAFAFNTLCR